MEFKKVELNELNQITEKCDGFVFKDFKIGKTNIRVFYYKIQFPGMFDTPEKREMRGITFNLDTGEIISRPLHKFFNIHEVENPELDEIISIQEKLDGSMIHPFIYKDESGKEKIWFKTKASPFSDVAIDANEFIENELNYSDEFKKFNFEMLKNGFTPIYEFYHPKHKIVIDYGNAPFIKLLAIRKTEIGEYVEFNTVQDLKDYFGNSIVEKYKFLTDKFIPKRYSYDLETLKKLQKEETGKEGYVVVNSNSERYKIKTIWYIDRHQLFGLKEKQIFNAIIEDKLDDIKSAAVLLKINDAVEKIERVEKIYQKLIYTIFDVIRALMDNTKNMEPKDKVQFVKNYLNKIPEEKIPIEFKNLVFNIVMRNVQNPEEQFIEYLKKSPKKYWQGFRKLIN